MSTYPQAPAPISAAHMDRIEQDATRGIGAGATDTLRLVGELSHYIRDPLTIESHWVDAMFNIIQDQQTDIETMGEALTTLAGYHCKADKYDEVLAENTRLRGLLNAPGGIPAGLYAEVGALRDLRNQVKAYIDGYLQDEVEDRDACISDDQHLSAAMLNNLLQDAFAAHWDSSMSKETPLSE